MIPKLLVDPNGSRQTDSRVQSEWEIPLILLRSPKSLYEDIELEDQTPNALPRKEARNIESSHEQLSPLVTEQDAKSSTMSD